MRPSDKFSYLSILVVLYTILIDVKKTLRRIVKKLIKKNADNIMLTKCVTHHAGGNSGNNQ